MDKWMRPGPSYDSALPDPSASPDILRDNNTSSRVLRSANTSPDKQRGSLAAAQDLLKKL